uniref:Putative secreted protein n=1 Tax=Amblyomma triste TaxID=251400 RepID=A0A023G1X2_AMBTT
MNAVLKISFFLLCYAALVKSGNVLGRFPIQNPLRRPNQMRNPYSEIERCASECIPHSSRNDCPYLCGCYRETGSRWYGRCFSRNGPHPHDLDPMFIGPLRRTPRVSPSGSQSSHGSHKGSRKL